MNDYWRERAYKAEDELGKMKAALNATRSENVALIGGQWAKVSIDMLNELRMDYPPGELKDTDGVKAIRALRAKALPSADVPICDGHAQAWFCERNHLIGGMDAKCVVCAFSSAIAPSKAVELCIKAAESFQETADKARGRGWDQTDHDMSLQAATCRMLAEAIVAATDSRRNPNG